MRIILKKKRKIFIVLFIIILLLAVLYFILVNFLVSAALVPSFMRKLESFERITDESYAAQVQTSDIQVNRQLALNHTDEWLEATAARRISAVSADGYLLIATVFYREAGERAPDAPAADEGGSSAPDGCSVQDAGSALGGNSVPDEGSAPAGRSLPYNSIAQNSSGSAHLWALVLHGYTGWKEEMYPFACWYYEQGYQVVVPDLRCQGESDGDFIGMGWTDHYDCNLWIDYILSQDPDAQIVIHGQSMGASTALIMTGDEALSEHVAAVVSDCAYTDAYSMFGDKVTAWFHLPAFPLVDSARGVLKLRGGYDLLDASALNAVSKSRTPTLFIHGASDALISAQMSKDLYEAASCPKELLIIDGAGHAQAQDKDPEAYYGTITAFLAEYVKN